MVSQTLLSELNIILQEDYKLALSPTDLAQIGNSLVGIFELLAKMDVGSQNEYKNYVNKSI